MIQELLFEFARLLIAAASAAFGGDILTAFFDILRAIIGSV